jgi:hypothetical protein
MLGITCCAFAFAQDATTAPAPTSGNPKLQISDREWQFGEVWQGTPLSFDVTLRNVGDAPLTLDVKSSCGCTVPTRPRSPLNPGESDTMTIKYDSAHRRGPAAQTVTITTNDPAESSVPFKVMGTVKPLFELKPVDTLAFGRLFQSSEVERTIDITNLYNSAIGLKLKDGQTFDAFNVTLETIEEGKKYKLVAKTKPPLSVGTARAEAVIETTHPDYKELKVTMYAAVQAPIALHPSRLFLPKSAVSEMQHRLRVAYAPERPVRVVEVKPSHPALKAEIQDATSPEQPASPAGQEIVVTLPPGDKVPDGEDLYIEVMTDATDASYQKLRVPIRVIAAGAAATQPATLPAPTPAPSGIAPTTQPAPSTPRP